MKKRSLNNELGAGDYSLGSNLLFCLRQTLCRSPLILLLCCLCAAVNAILPTLSAFLPKVIVERLGSDGGLPGLILPTLALALAIAALSGLGQFFEKYLYHRKFAMNSHYLRMAASKGLSTDYPNQENERFRKLQTESFNCCNGNYSPLTMIYDAIAAFSTDLCGFAIYFVLLCRLSPIFALLLGAAAVSGYFLKRRTLEWTAANAPEKAGFLQRTGYIGRISSDVRSAKDIRLYGMTSWLGKLYSESLGGLSGWYKMYAEKLFGVSAGEGAVALIRDGASYAYLLYMVFSSRLGLADFVLYIGVIAGFSAWLTGILTQTAELARISLSVSCLRAYLDYPEVFAGTDAVKDAEKPRAIELRDVSYRYDGAEGFALSGINLTISPGEHLAVVGLNGAGKTTLVKLVCGLCDPTLGQVLYGGADVKSLDRRSYYRLFSAVFQQYSILPVTLLEIVAERPAESADREKAESCLRLVGLYEKVAGLPNGLDSEFGRELYDDGVQLSGGEIQKLLLARAIYRGSPVMLLDEPTAALDPLSENRLYETYDEVTKGRSVVFVSHRLASTRFCDRIVLIDGGTIREEGTHGELIAKNGLYRELFDTQAKYYREKDASCGDAMCGEAEQ